MEKTIHQVTMNDIFISYFTIMCTKHETKKLKYS